MIHTYSLIHDDLPAMDDDDLRRGKPTNHKIYGDAIAILAGDGLLTEAFTVFVRFKLVIERCSEKYKSLLAWRKRPVRKAWWRAKFWIWNMRAANAMRPNSKTFIVIKTGKLILSAVMVGGYAASADADKLALLETFGRKIGLAFQIADDILDITQTTEQLGKNAKSDLKKNKSTYPSLIGLDASKQKAENLLKESVALLSTFGERATFLQELATLIVRRQS